MTRDIEGAKRFYRDAIGWTFAPMKMDWGTYWLAKAGGKNVGLFELKGPEFDGVPESWMSYLAHRRRRGHARRQGSQGRRAADEADLRCSGRRPDRDPHAAWRSRRRLDDAKPN